MDYSNRPRLTERRLPRRIVWGLAALGVAAVGVEISRTGLDVLLLVLLVLAVVLLERTVGDWLGELLGSGRATLVLGTAICLSAWSLLSEGGAVDKLFAVAGQKGYGTLYFRSSVPPPSAQPSSATPAAGTSGDQRAATSAPQPTGTMSAGTAASSPVPSGAETAVSSSAAPSGPLSLIFGRRASSTMRITTPTPIATGDTSTIRVRLTSAGEAVSGRAIIFTLDGRLLGESATGPDGTATMTFSVRVARSYQIRAEFAGDEGMAGSSGGATVVVLPGKS